MENKSEPEERRTTSSLFPLFPAGAEVSGTSSTLQWLSNTSFTTDLSVVAQAVREHEEEEEEEKEEERGGEEQQNEDYEAKSSRSYHFVEESVEGDEKFSDSDRDTMKEKREEKNKTKRSKRKRSREGDSEFSDFGSGKSNVRARVDSLTKPAKDYYFDTHPDPDTLAFGSLYRMDIPRYKSCNPKKSPGFDSFWFYRWNQKGPALDQDGDASALDNKTKSGGRYWSAKYAALERHKDLKRIHHIAPRKSAAMSLDDFIPLSDEGADNCSISKHSVVEESWEDEVLRKTRDFNKLTREHPCDEKVWLAFAEFQDKVASMQTKKGARFQILEKKISILEKAVEINPDNEELLLCLLKAYRNRDSPDILIGRWQKILMQHSGNYKLWQEFLHVVQGEFSRFKVSDVRKMYSHAIQALSAACGKQSRQVHQSVKSSDPDVSQLELGLVHIFISLCRFEWQAGYHELATALFQAEIEFSLFCPSLLLTESSKQRLFEHFWNSNGARVGEEGAIGWSTWLEKEEENRQKVMKEAASHNNEVGGWSGWSEPLSKSIEAKLNPGEIPKSDVTGQDVEEEIENENVEQEEDTEALLKMLGIDVGADVSGEVNDTSTWARWSEEESSRDCCQWMPLRTNTAGISCADGTTDREADDQFLRVVFYEDVSEYLFSLSSGEARLSLVYQFIDFFGGKIFQWMCTNSSSWIEKIISLEVLPDSIMEKLRKAYNVLTRKNSSLSGFDLEYILGTDDDISRKTEMMAFLRNAILLCLTAFPRNYVLEEAALVAEELFVTRMGTLDFSATPCQSLAKRLLKSDRQNILLCGVYARREAFFGNIENARRVFDMALLSIAGLPLDMQSHSPLLYFWYAEAELNNSSGSSQESLSRAIHILCCLGSGMTYSPFKCQPSSLQLLRAHQGFRERIKSVRSTWSRGVIDDQSVALICSASLFEEATTGWAAGIDVLDQTLKTVLPERRSQSYQLEFLLNYYMKMVQRHYDQSGMSRVWESISQGLQMYPFSPELFNDLVEISHLYTTSNKLRWMFDDYFRKKPSMIVWLYALSFEIIRGASKHRIHGLFERALANEMLHKSVLLWRSYIAYEIKIACNPSAAKQIFFRAIHACPGSKRLWLDGFRKLNSILTAKELSDLQEVMRDKELNLRTDIYEILLQDENVP